MGSAEIPVPSLGRRLLALLVDLLAALVVAWIAFLALLALGVGVRGTVARLIFFAVWGITLVYIRRRLPLRRGGASIGQGVAGYRRDAGRNVRTPQYRGGGLRSAGGVAVGLFLLIPVLAALEPVAQDLGGSAPAAETDASIPGGSELAPQDGSTPSETLSSITCQQLRNNGGASRAAYAEALASTIINDFRNSGSYLGDSFVRNGINGDVTKYCDRSQNQDYIPSNDIYDDYAALMSR